MVPGSHGSIWFCFGKIETDLNQNRTLDKCAYYTLKVCNRVRQNYATETVFSGPLKRKYFCCVSYLTIIRQLHRTELCEISVRTDLRQNI